MLVVKDSSANKCGVVCSSYEILAAHLLSRGAFEAQKSGHCGRGPRPPARWRLSRPTCCSRSTRAFRARCPTSRGASRRRSTSWPTQSSRRRATTRSPRSSSASTRAPAADARATRYRVAGQAAGRLRARLRRVLRRDAACLRRGHHARRSALGRTPARLAAAATTPRRGAARRVAAAKKVLASSLDEAVKTTSSPSRPSLS